MVKAKKGRSSELMIALSELAIRNNVSVIEYCRTSMAALSGSTAGLIGLTGLWGFVFYFITAFALWVMLMLKAGSKWKNYFINSRTVLTNGLLGGLFTYILFWTFIYGMVHVY